MELGLYDTALQHATRWSGLTMLQEELKEECAKMRDEIPDVYETIKIHPYDVCMMYNPVIHEVGKLVKGDRLALIIFLGRS